MPGLADRRLPSPRGPDPIDAGERQASAM